MPWTKIRLSGVWIICVSMVPRSRSIWTPPPCESNSYRSKRVYLDLAPAPFYIGTRIPGAIKCLRCVESHNTSLRPTRTHNHHLRPQWGVVYTSAVFTRSPWRMSLSHVRGNCWPPTWIFLKAGSHDVTNADFQSTLFVERVESIGPWSGRWGTRASPPVQITLRSTFFAIVDI